MAVTKTVNPLHFEDLEPHRFEDLVRQLIYDFREWKSLEATGRLGSDEGVDILAVEQTSPRVIVVNSENIDDELEAVKESTTTERSWVVQCKREKSINPKKLTGIIRGNLKDKQGDVYGYLFVAACDFSKAARDSFRNEVTKYGVQEFYLWGKAELEDMLVLPKNDHLLFAYFGISLQVKRRYIKTQLLSRLSLKRKLVKELGDLRQNFRKPILIRNPQDEGYPHIDSVAEFIKAPRWRYWWFRAHQPPDHLAFVFRSHYAYMDWEKKEWDVLEDYDAGIPSHPRLHGLEWDSWDKDRTNTRFHGYWLNNIPEKNRAWANEVRFVHYDRILALDDLGDAYHEGPHLLVEYYPNGEPFEPRTTYVLEAASRYGHRLMRPDEGKRIKFFPEVIPDVAINDPSKPAA